MARAIDIDDSNRQFGILGGLLLQIIVAIKLGWLPAGGYVALATDPVNNLRAMTLPVRHARCRCCCGAGTLPRDRYCGNRWLYDFVATARAKGLAQGRIIVRHVLLYVIHG